MVVKFVLVMKVLYTGGFNKDSYMHMDPFSNKSASYPPPPPPPQCYTFYTDYVIQR